jgi:NAD+--dinitrogen-reductase ADP-D-ribosyltransferase
VNAADGITADRGESGARWTTTNLVGVPAPWLCDTGFNADPQPLHIAGVRQAHAGLFAELQRSGDAAQARASFAGYMNNCFALKMPGAQRPRPSYLKLLQGWGQDANGPAGAVLKGWVESRFGLVPLFHKVRLGAFPSAAWTGFAEEQAHGAWRDHSMLQQLDLLFEFCQWMLAFRLPLAPGTHLRLWRGSNRCDEQVVAGSMRERRCTMRLNNLVSFSRSRDDAGVFGDWVMQAEVPRCKLLLLPGLLDSSALSGEAEVLAIGGDYDVQVRYD